MTFSEFLKEHFLSKIIYDGDSWDEDDFKDWQVNLNEHNWINLATRWHEDEAERMIPSEEELESILDTAYLKTENVFQGQKSAELRDYATAIRTFLEGRGK